MAVTKAKKHEQVKQLAGELKSIKNGFVAEFGKLTVANDDELRKAIRGTGAKYRVVKNTLAERAAQGTAFESVVKSLAGRTSIAYTSGDPVTLAKALTKYAKDNPELIADLRIVESMDTRQQRAASSMEVFSLRKRSSIGLPYLLSPICKKGVLAELVMLLPSA